MLSFCVCFLHCGLWRVGDVEWCSKRAEKIGCIHHCNDERTILVLRDAHNARQILEGHSTEDVIERIVEENLFQYPTEKSVRRMARVCLRSLKILEDSTLVEALATQPFDIGKQICLYAMMKQYRLVREFMVTVIGEKYRTRDFTFGKTELNAFFFRLQEQDNVVTAWSDHTIAKLKQVLMKILVENGYINSIKADRLNAVWLSPLLENAIRIQNDNAVLPAFNCFS